jgi:hypothetical protein
VRPLLLSPVTDLIVSEQVHLLPVEIAVP